MAKSANNEAEQPSAKRLYGCIEAGGTKFVVGIVSSAREILETARFDTVSPDVTIGATTDWLKSSEARYGMLSAVGIASFGPVELNRAAPDWGFITATTKPGWSNTDFGRRVQRAMQLPVGFDTDVNGAALAESRWGAGIGENISIYVTVGTGIGAGAVIDGKVLRGLSHPEMGHINLPRHPDDLAFAGICPFHGDCLEGLVSGPAIKARWGVSLSELPDDHPAHLIVAWYLAQMVVTLQSVMEPGRIVFGGGVMATPGLLARVRETAKTLGKGYFRGNPDDIVVAPALGSNAGLLGALALAQDTATSD